MFVSVVVNFMLSYCKYITLFVNVLVRFNIEQKKLRVLLHKRNNYINMFTNKVCFNIYLLHIYLFYLLQFYMDINLSIMLKPKLLVTIFK